jgi:hypothetical protein
VTVTPHSRPCLAAPSFSFTHQLRVATPTKAIYLYSVEMPSLPRSIPQRRQPLNTPSITPEACSFPSPVPQGKRIEKKHRYQALFHEDILSVG